MTSGRVRKVRKVKRPRRMDRFTAFLCLILAIPSFAFTDSDIASHQREIATRPAGERIAYWAERFVGVPYDPDPLGEYVTKRAIVADDRVDCMYLTFRTAELALGRSPKGSVEIALDKRFKDRGMLEKGVVLNYDDRFQYGEDMLDSGKWGREITDDIGPVSFIKGSRGRELVKMISKETLIKIVRGKRTSLKSGDIIFFVKAPEKRVAGEIVGHIGTIKLERGDVYLIHASGRKNGDGRVKKVLLRDYAISMPFAGVRVSRFP